MLCQPAPDIMPLGGGFSLSCAANSTTHAGSMWGMTMTAEQIAALISERMPEADPVRVEGDDGVHFSALVVSPAFEGMRPVQRHQRVYAALEGLVGGAIHALALETLTPAEWSARDALN